MRKLTLLAVVTFIAGCNEFENAHEQIADNQFIIEDTNKLKKPLMEMSESGVVTTEHIYWDSKQYSEY